MPYMLDELVIDRVDFVDEGANSAAFIELFKRKERNTEMDFNEILSKLKPEHAEVIKAELEQRDADLAKAREDNATLTGQLSEANTSIATISEELAVLKAAGTEECDCDGEADESGVCSVCGKPKPKKKSASFDETELLKSMPAAARELFTKMREQKEAAEEQVRKAAEERIHNEAVAKAATMKALPIAQEELVEVLKGCDSTVANLLAAANEAIETVVLGELGKSKPTGASDVEGDAWAKIEAKADEVAKRDNVTKQRAINIVIKENPDLYREYLNGGAN